ncbi:hypothetical protein HNR50_000544 [Spirochaeta isovalerica]|uniref:Uncharacterized protein n=1 Tax=Spirochaeta isovalerica TaxID=150 RepID=A0A841R697_9SPIO|nr:hypothetical protein [Spirochaeta isovalerica]
MEYNVIISHESVGGVRFFSFNTKHYPSLLVMAGIGFIEPLVRKLRYFRNRLSLWKLAGGCRFTGLPYQ